MKRSIWLFFDLWVKGDYQGLYAWLDNHQAKECGEGVAFLTYEADSAEQLLARLKRELESAVAVGKDDRIYITFRGDDGNPKGRFLFGKRRAAPWQGYGSAALEDDV